jgi:DNA-binding LacI/PurR family transcriptional regulator
MADTPSGGGGRPVTIKEVAERAGVSTATVSRVTAGKQGAGAAVRSRVLKTVRQLGYAPNRIARNLRLRQRKVVGVVIPDLQNPFFTGIVVGIEEVLHAAEYTLLIANADDRAEREADEVRALRAEGAAGLLVIPSGPDPSVSASSGPVVAIDRSPAGWAGDLVKTANAEGARQAVSHLIRLGHTRIALLNGPAHYDVARERSEGFLAAMKTAGLSCPAAWRIDSDFRQVGGYESARRLLQGRERPRALFVTNALMTLGALQAIHELRLRIPQDIAIVSFDDMPWAASLNPALTAVAQPTREIGRTAAQLLLERLADPARPGRQVVLPPTLVIRASCGVRPR